MSKRSILLRAIGPRRLGAARYVLRPGRRVTWNGPFNGQAHRCLLFAALVERLRPAAIVETGTYLGTTTEWLAAFQMPVFTCESSEENFGFAEARLSPIPNVTATLEDSREFLSRLLKGPLLHARQEPVIFYLDAHWNADLPLAEEVEIIYRHCPKALVMIDDFQVPFDAGYGYDDYGPGKALTPDYIAPLLAAHGLKPFYPSTPSAEEGGARRGCVVLAGSAAHEGLGSTPLLRAADAPPIFSATATNASPDAR